MADAFLQTVVIAGSCGDRAACHVVNWVWSVWEDDVSKGSVLRVLSGMGDVACLARSLGAYVWQTDAFHKEIVRHVPFGMAGGVFPVRS